MSGPARKVVTSAGPSHVRNHHGSVAQPDRDGAGQELENGLRRRRGRDVEVADTLAPEQVAHTAPTR